MTAITTTTTVAIAAMILTFFHHITFLRSSVFFSKTLAFSFRFSKVIIIIIKEYK